MKSPHRFGLARLSVALLVGMLASGTASAQDADALFREGVDLYLQGGEFRAQALEKFTEVLALNPSHEDAFRMYQQAGSEVFWLMMSEGGEAETMAKRFLELSSLGRVEKQNDQDAIDAHVEAAMSGNYVERRDALFTLSANHGEYGAAPFIPYLADEDRDVRVLAITALLSLAGDSVLPLCAALGAEDDQLVRNAAYVLGGIGDERAVPYLKHLFETHDGALNGDSEPTVREAANAALREITGQEAAALESSTVLHTAAALAYFTKDDMVVKPFDTAGAVWELSGRSVIAQEVPALLRPYELARQHCEAVLHDPGAQAMLLACLAAEKAAITHVEGMGADMDDETGMVEQLQETVAATLASGGPTELSAALGVALDNDAPDAAVVLIDALGSLGAPAPGLRSALENDYKIVRYHAAFALASNGVQDAAVVRTLVEALGEDAVRTALVIDDGDETRNQLVDLLTEAGYSVVAAPNGGLGFARARTAPPKDVILLRDGMASVTVDQFVYDADFRTAASPMLLLCTEERAEAASANFEGKGNVQGILVEPFTAEAMEQVAGALADINDERALALVAAERAARILAELSTESLTGAADGLVSALTTHADADSVLEPVLLALGRVGPETAVPAVGAIFADEERSEELRLAAAMALGGMFSRMSQRPEEAVLEPVFQTASSGDSAALRLAASQALGWARFLSPEDRAELLRN